MTPEELAKKKRDHPGLFSKPNVNHVTKTKRESRISEILGKEEWLIGNMIRNLEAI